MLISMITEGGEIKVTPDRVEHMERKGWTVKADKTDEVSNDKQDDKQEVKEDGES